MSELQEFIDRVGKAAQSYYGQYKILPSLCIAQALLESNKVSYKAGLKLSGLAANDHNYFGMKWSEGCGCAYKEYKTSEQRADGSYYTVTARFRKYPSLEAGIKGYFEFLQYPRYANLKGVTDYKRACELIRQDGWATSLGYTNNLIARIEYLNLTEYDKPVIGGLKYFSKYSGSTGSLVDALNAVGADSSYAYRKRIAAVNGVSSYSGSANQNTYLLLLLKQGKLVKP